MKKPTLTCKISQEVYDWLKTKAAANRRTLSETGFFCLEAMMAGEQYAESLVKAEPRTFQKQRGNGKRS